MSDLLKRAHSELQALLVDHECVELDCGTCALMSDLEEALSLPPVVSETIMSVRTRYVSTVDFLARSGPLIWFLSDDSHHVSAEFSWSCPYFHPVLSRPYYQRIMREGWALDEVDQHHRVVEHLLEISPVAGEYRESLQPWFDFVAAVQMEAGHE